MKKSKKTTNHVRKGVPEIKDMGTSTTPMKHSKHLGTHPKGAKIGRS